MTPEGSSGRRYRVISGDSHLEVPPDDWTPWLPEAYRDRAPQIVRDLDGVECWRVEGTPLLPIGPEVSAGADPTVLRRLYNSFYEADGVTRRIGVGDAVQKLHELDDQGIDAEVLYPPFFVNNLLRRIEDNRAYKAMLQAWNGWLAEGYCAVAPDRLLGLGIVPDTGVDDAIAEMRRCKQLGLRGIAIKHWPNGSGRYDPADDRFFEALLEEDMRLTPHISFGDPLPTFRDQLSKGVSFKYLEGPSNPHRRYYAYKAGREACASNILEFIANGVFDRFPELQVYFGESQAYWVPDWIFNAEDWFYTYHHWYDAKLNRPIGDYVRQHVIFNFVRGNSDVHRAHEWDGVDNVTWGTDAPHSATTFPWSQAWLERVLDGEPDDVRHKVLAGNLIRFFGLDADRELTPTPPGGPYVHPDLEKRPGFDKDEVTGRYVNLYA